MPSSEEMESSYTFGDVDWSGYTVILPSISVGRAGQLCNELLLSRLTSPAVQRLPINQHEALMSVCGHHSNGDLVAALEGIQEYKVNSYVVKECHCVLLQMRSFLIDGSRGRRRFVADLINALKSAKVDKVVVVTGTEKQERIDEQLTGSQLRFVTDNDVLKEQFLKLKWIPLEKRVSKYKESSKNESKDDSIFLPGGGFAKHLYEQGAKSELDVAILARFASPGHDIGAASDLLDRLLEWRIELRAKMGSDDGDLLANLENLGPLL